MKIKIFSCTRYISRAQEPSMAFSYHTEQQSSMTFCDRRRFYGHHCSSYAQRESTKKLLEVVLQRHIYTERRTQIYYCSRQAYKWFIRTRAPE